MRALLVVNPKATTTSARARDVLAHALASETKLDLVETGARGHATELAYQAAVDGLDVVVALGGDGTVNEVVNGLLRDGPRAGLPALAVVPAGSTNVFARALGLPNSPVEATSVLLDGLRGDRRRSVGLARANDRWFTFCAGLGIDAGAVRRMERHRSQGRPATPSRYVRAALREFYAGPSRRRPALTLTVDGGEPQALGLALIGNTAPWTFLGERPVHAYPDASFDRGLDVLGLRRLGTFATLRHLAQMMSTRPRVHGRNVLALHDVPRLTITADLPLPLQLDGEDLGDSEQVVFRAVPGALEVVI